ncbi:MAG TPA: hypothetical protein VKS79_06445 [Gemmataceae bacterium]|nr:hypothetical protein [Gemmataceae bacterium]
MARFYLLPPRSVVADCMARSLRVSLPGLPIRVQTVEDLLDVLQSSYDEEAEVFVLFREEIPDGVNLELVLEDAFGAEFGDEITELRLTGNGQLAARTWRFEAMPVR